MPKPFSYLWSDWSTSEALEPARSLTDNINDYGGAEGEAPLYVVCFDWSGRGTYVVVFLFVSFYHVSW